MRCRAGGRAPIRRRSASARADGGRRCVCVGVGGAADPHGRGLGEAASPGRHASAGVMGAQIRAAIAACILALMGCAGGVSHISFLPAFLLTAMKPNVMACHGGSAHVARCRSMAPSADRASAQQGSLCVLAPLQFRKAHSGGYTRRVLAAETLGLAIQSGGHTLLFEA
jgi:hypothetical protein